MRRLMIGAVVVLALALVGGAGYLGFHRVQVEDTGTPQEQRPRL